MRTIAYAVLVPLLSLVGSLTPSVALAQGGSVTFGGSASTQTGASGQANGTAQAPAAAAAPAAMPAAAKEEPKANEKDEWAERDRKLNESMTLTGGVGLLRTQHAQGGAPGQFRLAFTTEYFSAGFLCTSSFPCKDPRGGAAITSDSLDHIGGTIGLTAQILPWLEGYATTSAYANSDPQNRPSLLQVLGDTDFGVKAFGSLSKVFHAGGAMELWLVNGTGAVGVDGSGTSAKFRGLGTMDLRGLESKTPLRFSTNLTYSLDNSGDVLASTEGPTGRNTPVTRIERFGLNVNRVDHFDIALGGEFFAAEEKVRPFVEYVVAVPVNRQGYLCKRNNPSGDHCLADDAVAPSKLTLGSRFFPWKHGFGLTAALDIGLTGTGTFIEEVAPTPPWTLYLGASWAIDTWDRPPVEKTKIIEKQVGAAKPKAVIHGTVHEKDKEGGIANAIVAWENHPEWTSLATNENGKFNTFELADGEYRFTVKADGYKDGQCAATIQKQEDATVDCALESNPKVGAVVGHVKDADSNAPVTTATVKVTDAQSHESSRVNVDSGGGFRIENLPPGTAQVAVEADGYLTTVVPTDVKVRTDNTADVMLKKRPKNPLVAVKGKEITIKQQIQFALDSATILPESNGLLTEIADVILKNPQIKKIEVQGHTDNTGTPEHNRALSEERANAVRTWLVQHGVSSDRLIAKGYGDTKPLAPNVTAAMKARNRRVQFIIVEQEGAPATEKKGNSAPLPVPMPF